MDTSIHIKSYNFVYDVSITDDKSNKVIFKKNGLSQEEFNKFFEDYEKTIEEYTSKVASV